MKNSALLLLSALTGFSGLCSSPVDDELSPPDYVLDVENLELQKKTLMENGEWMIRVNGVGHGIPGWNIDWCEDTAACVTVEDSVGRKAAKVHFQSWVVDQETNRVYLSPLGWLPAAGSQWVRVKGEVPFVVSKREAVTEPAVVKILKGFSVPLVLKEATLGKDGSPEDVEAVLVVTEYRDVSYAEDSGGEGKKVLELEVKTKAPVGIRNIELKTKDGDPVIVRDWGGGKQSRSWEIEKVKDGELHAWIRYSQGLKKCKAVMDGKVSLAGCFMKENVRVAKSASRSAGTSFSVCERINGNTNRGIMAELIRLRIENENREEEKINPARMLFDVELSVNKPAVFGGAADMRKQTLEVEDSTGRVLSPVAFDLTWLPSFSLREGVTSLLLQGKGAESASPGATWLRIHGTLRIPVATIRESPVYELPLEKGAELQIPVPGAPPSGGDGIDVSEAGDIPFCRLIIKDLRGDKGMRISLEVEGTPFELDCFELVDEQGIPLKNVCSSGSGSLFNPEGTERSWDQMFTIGNAADWKKVRVRLRYKTNVETAIVPVDCKIGLGGPLPRKTGVKQP
ncbi:hypothetical protein [Akkermansia sp.]|uniref:hypothetical protein n=1 Tax=Akkermansia sp. TaxID=1872421 RepID=UPI0025BB8D2C|nr:hypothetical protein [Akkermansia sp.]MCC8149071.1 hypothetical protein [Akkermansia sp.]